MFEKINKVLIDMKKEAEESPYTNFAEGYVEACERYSELLEKAIKEEKAVIQRKWAGLKKGMV